MLRTFYKKSLTLQNEKRDEFIQLSVRVKLPV
jgi:hypothetical protein